MILDSFVHLFDVVVRIFRVWEVHTHQINATAVDQDRCFDGALIDVIGVNNSFSPPSVQMISLRANKLENLAAGTRGHDHLPLKLALRYHQKTRKSVASLATVVDCQGAVSLSQGAVSGPIQRQRYRIERRSAVGLRSRKRNFIQRHTTSNCSSGFS